MQKDISKLLTISTISLILLTLVACGGDSKKEAPKANLIANPLVGESPLEVTFDASNSTGKNLNYAFNFGDGNTKNDAASKETHTYQQAGTYTATLTVKNDDNLTDTATVNITVEAASPNPNPNPNPNPTPVNNAPKINSLNTNKGYTADKVPYIRADVVADDSDGDTLTYTWMLNDKAVGDNDSEFYYENADLVPGVYTLKITVSDGRLQDSKSETIEIESQATTPDPVVTPDQGNITGQVSNKVDTSPIADATIKLYNIGADTNKPDIQPAYPAVNSDDKGNFAFVNVAIGNYIIVATQKGFTKITQTITVEKNKEQTVNITMDPEKPDSPDNKTKFNLDVSFEDGSKDEKFVGANDTVYLQAEIVDAPEDLQHSITWSIEFIDGSGILPQAPISLNKDGTKAYFNAKGIAGRFRLLAKNAAPEASANITINTTLGYEPIVSKVCQGDFRIYGNDLERDVRNIKDCTEITGNLIISGLGNLKDLAILSSLQKIGGDLHISDNGALTSLTGLENLNSVRDLYIERNHALTSLKGLENLTSLEVLSIHDNDALTRLTRLENITSLGDLDLRIEYNDTLTSLEGLENLTSLGRLYIYDNHALTSLKGLENITSIGHLWIDFNDALTSLKELENITSLRGLWIHNNYALTSLKGLENITSLEMLEIYSDYTLTSLTGLENLTSVVSLDIYGNALTSLKELKNITSVGGDLNIGGNALTSLKGLENITSVGGDLRIYNSNSLTSLTGLENLKEVKGSRKEISNNPVFDCTPYNTNPPAYFPLTRSINNKVNCTIP